MKPEFKEDYEKLGTRIAFVRRAKDLTQSEVGERIGKDAKHISKIERASIGMSMDMLFMIARALDVPVHVLLDFRDIDQVNAK